MPSIFNLIGATILTWTAAYFFNFDMSTGEFLTLYAVLYIAVTITGINYKLLRD